MEGEQSNLKPKRFFVAPLLILLALTYIGFLLYQSVYVNYQTNKKISALEDALRDNKIRKQNLEVLIAYYKTFAFQELEARKKLGLKLPGEKVVKVDIPEETKLKLTESEPIVTTKTKSNLEYWIDYLFYPDV